MFRLNTSLTIHKPVGLFSATSNTAVDRLSVVQRRLIIEFHNGESWQRFGPEGMSWGRQITELDEYRGFDLVVI
jgi:hypothetical protein